MFYAFPYTVTSSDTADDPYRLAMPLTAGVIHQVDVLFQKDCAHKIHVQIFHGGLQLWPSNRGGSLRGDATVISFREFYEIPGPLNDLEAFVWTTDTGVLYEIIIQIGILPKKIVQPLSFEALLEVLTEPE